jgi:NCS1 family nucleobase:cation symporter-1
VSAPLVGALVLIGLVAIFAGGRVPSGALTSGDVTTAGFFSMLAIAIVWQVAYVPYVSDYSRYMPEETGGRGAFWGSYLGCVSSTVLLMSLGALVGVASADADAMVGLDALVGGLGTVILLGFAFAAAVSNSVNAYCSVLCSLTLIETFRRGWRPGVRARLQTTVVLHAVGLAIGLAGQGDFLGNYSNFITLLLYALVPWSAINLVDYYLLRRGRYVVSEFFERDGGRYGRWNVRALGVYALGVAVEVPFMVTSMYTGPIADHLGGVDVAWLVGFVVASVAYWSIGRGRAEPAPGPDLAEVAR